MAGLPMPGLLTPDWPLPAGVRALCTTRAGGVSAPPFDSFNLGDHVRDDPVHVAANHARLAGLTAPATPVFLQQVHGTRVLRLQADPLHMAASQGAQADACLATEPGVACTIMVADCVLVPQIFNGQRFNVSFDGLAHTMRVFDACMAHPAFQAAEPKACPDFEA